MTKHVPYDRGYDHDVLVDWLEDQIRKNWSDMHFFRKKAKDPTWKNHNGPEYQAGRLAWKYESHLKRLLRWRHEARKTWRQKHAAQLKAIGELTRVSQEMGLYD